MKYFFVAGERSGDQHASRLIRQLKLRDESAIICGWGGDQMKEAGAEIFTRYEEITLMGFWEVLKSLSMIKRKFAECRQDIRNFDPDVVVLVDFPGFNLRIAQFAKALGKKTCYYISPKVWAWRSDRIKTIKACVDEMLVILPFEEEFYQRAGFSVNYVGNPSFEAVQDYTCDEKLVTGLSESGRNIAFLPGSRAQEVKLAIDIINKLSNIYEDYHFLVAGVDNLDARIYQPLRQGANISLLFGKTYEILRASEVAVVTSGTASLEAALLDVPQVVVYKTSTMTFAFAKILAKVKFISLVNLIAGRRVVKELIQGKYNAVDIATELEYLLNDEATKKRISEGYSEIRNLIGTKEASKHAAKALWKLSRS